jgi:hypothetical protein
MLGDTPLMSYLNVVSPSSSIRHADISAFLSDRRTSASRYLQPVRRAYTLLFILFTILIIPSVTPITASTLFRSSFIFIILIINDLA